jgi:hypothetical protein
MISGINLEQVVNYSLINDTENPTVWKLGVLPSYMMGQLSSSVNQSRNEIDGAFKLLQLGLKGWENFSIEYKTEEVELFGRKLNIVPISILERIPLDVVTELSAKILEINKLSGTERKNS